ncbi:MAG: nucleoside phosphorylase [Desulfobulbus sp.]|nr:nucleoside phosphorylase [Desulfobulbus sp.]
MSDPLITPRRENSEPQLPAAGLFALNPSDTATMLNLAKEYGLKRHFLFNSQLFYNERFFLAGPAVGAPMAAICLEKLIALGARRIVLYGWCGSIHPDVRISDLFLPAYGLSEEGTSSHYCSDKPWNPALQQRLQTSLEQAGLLPKSGGIWTTDALYRETRQKIEWYRGKGVLAVDMEYTAMQAVATFREILVGGMMLVSDELFGNQWRAGFRQKSFRTLSRQTLGLLVSFFDKAILS